MKPVVKKNLGRVLFITVVLVVLGVINFSIWRFRLARDIDHQIALIRAAGLPTNGEEENNYYPAVPNSENAALKMADAFALLTNFNDSRSNKVTSIKFPMRNDDPIMEELGLAADYCALNSNALIKAGEAIKQTHCRYPVDLSQGAHVSLKHLVLLKHLAQIAALHTIVEMKNPTADISIIIGMARSLEDEPVLISKLVRIAMLNTAVAAVEHKLNVDGMDDSDLAVLGKMFAEAAKTNQMASAFIGDRAAFLSVFQMTPDEIAQLADSEEEQASTRGKKNFAGFQYYFSRFAGVFDLDKKFYLQVMATNIFLAANFPKSVSQISDLSETNLQKLQHSRFHFTLSKMLLPPFRSAINKEASALAKVQSAQTALAVERFRLAHGKFPEKLDELVPQFLSALPEDPFDGQPLRYRRLAKGYSIYSIGSDGQDNVGRTRPADAKPSDKTPYDLTFTVER